MRVDVVSIFPEYLEPLRLALPGRAAARGILDLHLHDLREWTHDVHRAVDDSPYGGGPGMVMKPEVWGPCLDDVCPDDAILVVPTPAGIPFTQALAQELSAAPHLVFACGRYEGIDQRVVDDAARRVRVLELSIGDYVLIGGEAATIVMVEAIVRLVDGVLGNAESHRQDSFSDGLLEAPAYTRPQTWRGLSVPDVLRGGDHAAIDAWRHTESMRRTRERRPDLLVDPSVASDDPDTSPERRG
ncbi:tRNA (guanosine(37)-N1)-methyltransferase TrmD [Williamsia deligens]|uniref:tRNA (guanine-N(1)-)-methyltransferase n=1 Tax=Williamsia deligens TaxID=321325 RepID=A0ABW3GGR5_9NOCA|nr:tRNA (guanosine(37)-N1)-methyltransferase TrmD [Williamsia deligens]MCP2195544.1 tRNA (guanine37-N1)-methyltransferase [Williamsia deligens]